MATCAWVPWVTLTLTLALALTLTLTQIPERRTGGAVFLHEREVALD